MQGRGRVGKGGKISQCGVKGRGWATAREGIKTKRFCHFSGELKKEEYAFVLTKRVHGHGSHDLMHMAPMHACMCILLPEQPRCNAVAALGQSHYRR